MPLDFFTDQVYIESWEGETMEELQSKFISLSKEVESLKSDLKEKNAALESLALEIGVGKYFQDNADKTVFKITIPSGTFVEYKAIGYERTKRNSEQRGSLSQKEAKDAGFNLGE